MKQHGPAPELASFEHAAPGHRVDHFVEVEAVKQHVPAPELVSFYHVAPEQTVAATFQACVAHMASRLAPNPRAGLDPHRSDYRAQLAIVAAMQVEHDELVGMQLSTATYRTICDDDDDEDHGDQASSSASTVEARRRRSRR